MKYVLPMIFGLIAGAAAGFVLVYLAPAYFSDTQTRLLGGAVAGGILGALVGAIGGDMMGEGGRDSSRFVVPLIFGVIGGLLGATKLDIVWNVLRSLNVPTPF